MEDNEKLGAVDVVIEEQDTPIEEEQDRENIIEDTQVEESAEEGDENDTFNPEDMLMGEDETLMFSELSDLGIDIQGEQFKNFKSKFESYGVTDPKIISEIAKGLIKENSKPIKATDVKARMTKELSSEEKASYGTVAKILKNSFAGDATLEKDYNFLMSEPMVIRAMTRVIKYMNKGVSPNPKPSTVTKSKNYISYEEGKTTYLKKVSQIRRENNDYISSSQREQVFREVANKLNNKDLQNFKEEFQL